MAKKLFSIIAIAVFLFSLTSTALAINIWEGTGSGGVTCNQSAINASGVLTSACTFCDALRVTQNILNYLVELAFAIVTAMIVWGAIQMIISTGSSEKFTHGRQTITDAVIGLLVIMGAWLIVNEFLHLMTGGLNIPWNSVTCH